MAAASIVLNNALCFLKNKLGKSGVKPLKSTVLDFYDAEDLSGAKRQLISDVKDLNLDIAIPHVPERREGDNKAVRIVDDMFTFLTFLDENQKISQLPCYVANSPDSLPSSRLYEGDLAIVMKLIEKMGTEIQSLSSTLAIVANDVRRGSKFAPYSHSSSQPVVNNERSGKPPQRRGSVSSGDIQMTSRVSLQRMENPPQVGSHLPTDVDGTRLDWAAAASTPVTVHNRYSSLADDDGHNNDDEFEEPRSRKRRRSRLERQREQQQQSQQCPPATSAQTQESQQRSSGEQRRSRGRVVLTGKSSVTSQRVAAAKQIIKKAVFCVDNLNPSLSADDLSSFVRNLNVRVLTCFEVKPRRRRHEEGPILDRKAFRLCVDDADRDRLLDESKWPDSVVISQWYRLDPATRMKESSNPSEETEEMDGALPSLSSAVEPMISSESTEENELENTVLYRNTAAAADAEVNIT